MTPKQRQCLDFIESYISANRCSPSYQDIIDHLGLKTRSSAHRLVGALVDRGLITTIPGHARSIRVVDRGGSEEALLNAAKSFVLAHRQGLFVGNFIAAMEAAYDQIDGGGRHG